MKIEGRFVVAVSTATLLTLGLTFLAVYITVTSREDRQFDEAVRQSARTVAEHLPYQAPSRPEAQTGPPPQSVAAIVPVMVLYEADGHAIPYSAIPFPPPSFEKIREQGEGCFEVALGDVRFRAAVVPVPGSPGSRLFFAASREEVEVEEAFLRDAMLIALGLSFLWTLFVSSFLVRRFAHGIDLLADVVRKVAEGDLSVRVPSFEGDPYVLLLADDIDEMIGRLDVLVRSQHEFIAHAAHELRSPLTTLYGELSLALRRPREAPEYQRAITEALDSTKRLVSLAEELLALARIADAPAPVHDLVTVDSVVEDAVRYVAGPLEERGLKVRTSGHGGTVRGRHLDLVRLLRNLLENAIRHSPDGGAIDISAEELDHDVSIRVRDEGPGVSEAEREKVFDPFYRGADVRASDAHGAGLGLAIVRGIARAHGGDVRVLPSTRGALFEVRLPRERRS